MLLLVMLISCSKDGPSDSTTPIDPVTRTGTQKFVVSFANLQTNKTAHKSGEEVSPAFALVTVEDATGKEVLTREKLAIKTVEAAYVTATIELTAGNFRLTEFIVLDANGLVLGMVPQDSSPLDPLVEHSLPYDFKVVENTNGSTAVENLLANGLSALDFGYEKLEMNFTNNVQIMELVVDETEGITSKTLTIGSVTGSYFKVDWGDGTIEEYKSYRNNGIEEQNELTHLYTEQHEFTIQISGPLQVIELFWFNNRVQEDGWKSHLTSIDLSKMPLLKSCFIFYGKFTQLDVSKNPLLEILRLDHNQITQLDVTQNTKLTELTLANNQLSSLDLSHNGELSRLFVDHNQLQNLNISQSPKIIVFGAQVNQLTTFDLSQNPSIVSVDLSDNGLTTIDLSQNIDLANINLGRNQFAQVDFTHNPNLQRIDLFENELNSLDVSQNPVLRDIYVTDNALTVLDLSHNPLLERLIIDSNNFNTVDISQNLKIFNLEVGNNQLDGPMLDSLIGQLYEQAVLNNTQKGYIDFKLNPGFDAISQTSLDQMAELQANYNWFFNNSQY